MLRTRALEALRARPALRHLASRILFAPLGRRQRFRLIWALDLWGGGVSRSGQGSSLEATRRLRAALPAVLAELGVRTLLDVPCGDFTWMQDVDLGDVGYVGVDIVPEIVSRNRERFGDSDRRRFILADATRDPLPTVDAILCRHLLPHLSFRDGLRVLGAVPPQRGPVARHDDLSARGDELRRGDGRLSRHQPRASPVRPAATRAHHRRQLRRQQGARAGRLGPEHGTAPALTAGGKARRQSRSP